MDNYEELQTKLQRLEERYNECRDERDKLWRKLSECKSELKDTQYNSKMEEYSYNSSRSGYFVAVLGLSILVLFLFFKGIACRHSFEDMDAYLNKCNSRDIIIWVNENYNISDVYDSEQLESWFTNTYNFYDAVEYFYGYDTLKDYIIDHFDFEDIEDMYNRTSGS